MTDKRGDVTKPMDLTGTLIGKALAATYGASPADQLRQAAAEITTLREQLSTAQATIKALEGELQDERMEHDLLKELLSRPQIDEFYDGIVTEAAHQRQRWGDAHDRDKSAENWFWLVGYLSGKALRSAVEGEQNKARHHTISSAAALFQWWKAVGASPNGVGADADLDPEQ